MGMILVNTPEITADRTIVFPQVALRNLFAKKKVIYVSTYIAVAEDAPPFIV